MSFRRRTVRRTAASGPPDAQAVYLIAVKLLARRDFSIADLRARLLSQGADEQAAEAAITELLGQGALNDERYAQGLVASRAGRGQGPLRIAAELRQAGVAQGLLEAALASGPDWHALARQVRVSRFGAAAPPDWAGKARQARFLQYRGFSSDHIRSATGADPESD